MGERSFHLTTQEKELHMTEQDTDASNKNAHAAAGPPPAAGHLDRSGLADQTKSPARKFLDKVTHFVTGSSMGKQS
jgi:hypothetical protein